MLKNNLVCLVCWAINLPRSSSHVCAAHFSDWYPHVVVAGPLVHFHLAIPGTTGMGTTHNGAIAGFRVAIFVITFIIDGKNGMFPRGMKDGLLWTIIAIAGCAGP